MVKGIFSKSLIFAVAPQIPRAISVLLLPLLTKYLTPVDFGISATILVYSGLLSGLKDLGLNVVIVNAFYRNRNNWLFKWKIIYGYLLLWAPIIFVIHWLIIFLCVPEEAVENRVLISTIVSLPVLLFDTISSLGFRYFQTVKRNVTYIAITTVISGSIIVGINYFTIVGLKMGYMGWFWSTLIGSAITSIFYAFPLFFKLKLRPIFFFNFQFLKKQLAVALPMIPHNYSSYLLNSSDRFVMSQVNVDIKSIGVYNIAYSMGNYAELGSTSLGLVLNPYINDLIVKKDNSQIFLKNYIFLLQFLFVLGLGIIALWMKEIFIFLISNNELREGYSLAVLIIMAYTYKPMYWVGINTLVLNNRTSKIWRITFLSGVFNISVNFLLIPILGFKIAAITTFVSMLFLGFGAFFMADFKRLCNQNYKPLLWAATISTTTILVFALKDVSYLIKILLTVCFAGIGFIGFKYYKKNQIKI